jgi:hypothetical protein
VERFSGDAEHRPARCSAEPGHAPRDRKWTPDQQRTTPQVRRAALHPGTPLASLAFESDETGQISKTCQAPCAKIFLFFRMANQI